MFILLAIMLFFMWAAVGWFTIMRLIFIAFMPPIAFRWARKNRPGCFDPVYPPADLLPEPSQS